MVGSALLVWHEATPPETEGVHRQPVRGKEGCRRGWRAMGRGHGRGRTPGVGRENKGGKDGDRSAGNGAVKGAGVEPQGVRAHPSRGATHQPTRKEGTAARGGRGGKGGRRRKKRRHESQRDDGGKPSSAGWHTQSGSGATVVIANKDTTVDPRGRRSSRRWVRLARCRHM
eukprot:scaffold5641_cov110-Isochrysis_galbana.AAC.2